MDAKEIKILFDGIKNQKIREASKEDFITLKDNANKLFDVIDERMDKPDIDNVKLRIANHLFILMARHIFVVMEGGYNGDPQSIEDAERLFNQSILPLF